jgi:tripartite-type tricarboxylate transporter receptor subunit TctC
VVPFPAGGATDILARLFGQKMGEAMNARFLVDNKPGATGAIGLHAVARAPADGYTLVLATASSLGTNPAVSKVPFDPVQDFTPIAMIAAEPMGLAVHPSVPAKNVQELIALAKAKPGTLTFASFGVGSVSHLAAELFSSMAGIKMLHVPYKGAAPATNDLIGGQVMLMFNSISVFVGPAKEGMIRMIASGGAGRSPTLPDLPTVAEQGLAGFEASTWHALLGPASLPPEIVTLLSAELRKALQLPEVQERLAALSLEPQSGTAEQLSAALQRDVAKWKKVVEEADIKLE